MYEDLNTRLARAAQRVAQWEKLSRHLADLQAVQQEAVAAQARLQAQVANDEHVVDRLEGGGLTALFYSILGSRDQQVEQHRQQALAEHLELETTNRRLTTVAQQIADARRQLQDLNGCREEQQTLLAQKEELIRRAPGPAAAELFKLGEREHDLLWRLQQLTAAVQAGNGAITALDEVMSSLDSAESWGAWDTWSKGGISTWAKHSHIDAAREAAEGAQHYLDNLRRELKELGDDLPQAEVNVGDFSKFVDYFFHNMITDFLIQNELSATLERVRDTRSLVDGVLTRLHKQAQANEAELAQLREQHQRFVSEMQ